MAAQLGGPWTWGQERVLHKEGGEGKQENENCTKLGCTNTHTHKHTKTRLEGQRVSDPTWSKGLYKL